MRYRIILLFALALCLVIVPKAIAQNNPSCKMTTSTTSPVITTLDNATIESITSDQSAMQVQCEAKQSTIAVKTPELKAILKNFNPGDRVVLEYAQDAQAANLQSLSIRAYQVPGFLRMSALLGSCLVALLFSALLLGGLRNLSNLIIGEDGRFSNSKIQMALWFFIVIVTYLAFTILRGWNGGLDFVGGVAIPQNLLMLSGLSALTFATAKAITQSKHNDPTATQKKPLTPEATANQASVAGNQVQAAANQAPVAGTPREFPANLFQNDFGQVDLGDFQMVIITLLAVVVYLVQSFDFLGTINLAQKVILPDVDTTILSTFGLGQGVYLVKKAVSRPGEG